MPRVYACMLRNRDVDIKLRILQDMGEVKAIGRGYELTPHWPKDPNLFDEHARHVEATLEHNRISFYRLIR